MQNYESSKKRDLSCSTWLSLKRAAKGKQTSLKLKKLDWFDYSSCIKKYIW